MVKLACISGKLVFFASKAHFFSLMSSILTSKSAVCFQILVSLLLFQPKCDSINVNIELLISFEEIQSWAIIGGGEDFSSFLSMDPMTSAENKAQVNLYFQGFLLFFLIIYAALRWLKYYGVPENFPPGPPCVPFLGVLPFIKVKLNFCQSH